MADSAQPGHRATRRQGVSGRHRRRSAIGDASCPEPLAGPLAIELKARPAKGASPQFFWASPTGGFNAQQQNQRQLNPADQVNSLPVPHRRRPAAAKLRFDPFSNQGEMEIESLTIYQLQSKTSVRPSNAQLREVTVVLMSLPMRQDGSVPYALIHPRDEIMRTMERIYRYRMTTTSGGNLSIREPAATSGSRRLVSTKAT